MEEEQIEIGNKVVKKKIESEISLIGGFDVTFKDEYGVGVLVVLDFKTLKLVYQDKVEFPTNIQYAPGFLGLREYPYFEKLYERLPLEFTPQITMIDGNGIFHPRRCGSASYIGVKLNIPTIGISKNFMSFEGLSGFEGEEFQEKGTGLTIKCREEIIAKVLYPTSSKHPIFVSIGNSCTLEEAEEITWKSCIHKIPEPIRQADLISRAHFYK